MRSGSSARAAITVTFVLATAGLALGSAAVAGDGGAPAMQARGQSRASAPAAPPGGAAIPFEDRTGFRDIFDGKTLTGWEGDPALWRVEAGAIVGETTAAAPLKQNTFLIWRGGEPADFELKLEFRINSTNSGVQYRSSQVPPGGDVGQWVLRGYQADIDFDNNYTGMLYEERARGFLALRGAFGYAGHAASSGSGGRGRGGQAASGPLGPIGQLENGEALKAFIRVNDWNQLHIIARGNVLVHVLNGHVTALFVDDNAQARAMKGLIGLQIHVGPPMKVEFRRIGLKTL